MNNGLQTDSAGDVLTKPVTGWTTGTVAGIAVLLAIQYVETPAELETGDSKQIQLTLTAQQSLELAKKLTTLAEILLADQSQATKH